MPRLPGSTLTVIKAETGYFRRPRSPQSGFTLIEMIVVMAIMAMVAGLVLVKQPWRSVGLNADMTVRALTGALRLARSRAIVQDRNVPVDIAPGGFALDGGTAWLVPNEETLSPVRIIFMPDGGSTGGRILVTAGARRIVVDVNWLTGRVRSGELAAE